MRSERLDPRTWAQGLGLAGIGAAGIVAIVGSGGGVRSTLLIEQAGRRYQATLAVTNTCVSAAWASAREATSLAASDFDLLDGRACTVGQARPDFSVGASPLHFGFVRFSQANTTPTEHGIDNWKVTVWRH